MKDTLIDLYNRLVLGNQKAILGFVLPTLAVYLTSVGLSLDMTLEEAIQALSTGLLTAVGVWFKSNRF